MNWDKELKKKANQAGDSAVGRFFLRLSAKIGGVHMLPFLHIGFILLVGILTSYPLFLAGGFWLALPTTLFTILVGGIVFFSLLWNSLGILFGRGLLRKLLVFAMLFSLPFSLLSLPLLQGLSQK